MKFIDINRKFTAAVSSYMAQGYYINAGTMGGSQGEVAHIDLTNGTEIIRVLLTTFNNYLGTEGVELIVGRVTTSSPIRKTAGTPSGMSVWRSSATRSSTV